MTELSRTITVSRQEEKRRRGVEGGIVFLEAGKFPNT